MGSVILTQLSDGNLEIKIDGSIRDQKTGKWKFSIAEWNKVKVDIADIHKNTRGGYNDLWDILEWYFCNDEYEAFPETDYIKIGALTSAPIIAYQVDRDDNGDLQNVQKVWWYPWYETKDPVEELIKHGKVIFENGELEESK